MTEYKKYLTESKNIAGSIAELAIEKMEDTLADFEMFIDEKLEKATTPNENAPLRKLKAQFYRSFDKQWESMKKDLIMIGKKLDQL
jgi:histidinol phosphatase-like enzyme